MADKSDAIQWQPEELERVDSCPACASSLSEPVYDALRDELEGVAGEWSMRRCLKCKSLYLARRPRPEAIGKAYRSYHTHADASVSASSDNGQSLVWRWSNGYMNARFGASRTPASVLGRLMLPLFPPLRQQLDYFYRHLPATAGRLLDVGCGNGAFLLRAQQAGWEVKGVEPDPKAVAAARRLGLDVVEGTLDTCDPLGLFDAVTASHVIEHVHDPSAFLDRMFGLLKPRGRAWIATPNVLSHGHRRYASAWRGLEPPRHMTVLSPMALRQLLANAGFTDIEAHRRGRGSSYILRTSAESAARQGLDVATLSPAIIDLLATFRSTSSEEIVMTATRGAT